MYGIHYTVGMCTEGGGGGESFVWLKLDYTCTVQSFKLENKATGACLYAGVLDFTSPVAEQAFIPQWMMDHLGVSNGMPSLYYL